MKQISRLVRARRSVRSYDEQSLSAADRDALCAFMQKIRNPYGVPVEFRLLDAAEHRLSSPVITGERLYIGAKLRRGPHMEEALGYSFEQLVLFAQSLGIGTVWIGGTMSRPPFERAMELREDEIMPCVTPVGYPAKKPSLRESMMRMGVKADSRQDFESLFFDGGFDRPLTPEHAGRLAEPLEMVRWAPSAVNKQPWRAVLCPDAVHFYLKGSKGFASEAAGNMQKIDMGIALCHFALSAEENGILARFSLENPGLTAPDMEYIASYRLN